MRGNRLLSGEKTSNQVGLYTTKITLAAVGEHLEYRPAKNHSTQRCIPTHNTQTAFKDSFTSRRMECAALKTAEG